jgi:hypothetical protein
MEKMLTYNKVVYLLLHRLSLDQRALWVNGSPFREMRYFKFVVESSIVEPVTLRLQYSMI